VGVVRGLGESYIFLLLTFKSSMTGVLRSSYASCFRISVNFCCSGNCCNF